MIWCNKHQYAIQIYSLPCIYSISWTIYRKGLLISLLSKMPQWAFEQGSNFNTSSMELPTLPRGEAVLQQSWVIPSATLVQLCGILQTVLIHWNTWLSVEIQMSRCKTLGWQEVWILQHVPYHPFVQWDESVVVFGKCCTTSESKTQQQPRLTCSKGCKAYKQYWNMLSYPFFFNLHEE